MVQKRRAWVKFPAAINIKNFEIIDYSITDDHVNDGKEVVNLIKRMKNRVSGLFGDRGYDSKAIYNELENKALIPVRKNTLTLANDSPKGLRLQGSYTDSVRNHGR